VRLGQKGWQGRRLGRMLVANIRMRTTLLLVALAIESCGSTPIEPGPAGACDAANTAVRVPNAQAALCYQSAQVRACAGMIYALCDGMTFSTCSCGLPAGYKLVPSPGH